MRGLGLRQIQRSYSFFLLVSWRGQYIIKNSTGTKIVICGNSVKFGLVMSVLKCFDTVPDLSNLTYDETQGLVFYSGEGENIGTRRGVVELLELIVILLF